MISALAQLLFSSLVCVGLLAVWAATSPRHWFLRSGTFVAALTLLLLIPAYEPFVVFALQGTVIAAGVQGARWWRRRKEPESRHPTTARYSLATLLLLSVFVAIAAAVAVRLPSLNFNAWQSVVLIGVVAGLATLLGLWIIHGRLLRWWLRIVVGLILSLIISLPLVWGDWLVFSMTQGYRWPRPESISIAFAGILGTEDALAVVWVQIIAFISLISASVLWLISGISAIGPITIADSLYFKKRWKRVLARCTLLLIALFFLAPPAGVYYQLMTPLPIPQTIQPNPNGYDDLIAAGKIVESSKELGIISNYDVVSQVQLSTAVKTLAPVYEVIKIGLEKQVRCAVDYNDPGYYMDSIQSMRSLARALASRGRLATMESRFDDAADTSLEGIRFGYAIRRGGLMIGSLVGTACSGIGRWNLYGIREELSASHCSSLISALGQFEKQAEPTEDFIHRDRVWSQHAMGWSGHLIEILEKTAGIDPYVVHRSFEHACIREQAEMRLLRLELAIQAWRKTDGRLPESLSELVPQIIDEIPVDPFDPDGGTMKYRRTEDGYVLYSVGPNGIDDGGIAPDEEDLGGFETGDLRLDIKYAPEPAAVEDDLEDGDESQ